MRFACQQLCARLLIPLILIAAAAEPVFAQNWAFTDDFEGVSGGSGGSGNDLDPDPTIWNCVNFWEDTVGDQTLVHVLNSPPPPTAAPIM